MRTLVVIKYVLATVGVGLLLGAAFWYQSVRSFVASASVAEGTVVDLVRSRNSNSYAPVVHFATEDGQQIEFTSTNASRPPSYAQGDHVVVLYLPSEPQEASIKSFLSLWVGPLVLAVGGGVLFLIGGGILIATRLRARRDEYLRTCGTPVKAKVQGVELNTSLAVNGRHPFRIVAHWQNPTTSELHIFESRNLWFDPSDYITDEEITVFIETNNPKKYYVDVSFLPKVAR